MINYFYDVRKKKKKKKKRRSLKNSGTVYMCTIKLAIDRLLIMTKLYQLQRLSIMIKTNLSKKSNNIVRVSN